MSSGARKLLWRLLTTTLVVAALALVMRQLGQGWTAAKEYPWQWRPWPLLFSVVLAQAGYVVLTGAWRSVLQAISIHVSSRTSYWIFILSNLGRYLPGRVWQIGAAAFLARSVGLNAREIGASMIVYQLYLLPVGAILTLSWGDLPGLVDTAGLRLWIWLGCLAAGWAAFWPHVLLHWIRPLATRLGMPPERWRMPWSGKLKVIFQCAAGWLLLSAAFGLLVLSVTQLDWRLWPELAKIFLASYILGYVTLVAPGGLGVREGVMALLLTPIAGAGPSAALALLARFWVTVTEIVALIPAWVWYRAHVRELKDSPMRTEVSEANEGMQSHDP